MNYCKTIWEGFLADLPGIAMVLVGGFIAALLLGRVGDAMWFVTGTSIIGTMANIQKKAWCFQLWFGTNLIWALYDFSLAAYAQSALGAAYVGLAVWGMWKWKPKWPNLGRLIDKVWGW